MPVILLLQNSQPLANKGLIGVAVQQAGSQIALCRNLPEVDI